MKKHKFALFIILTSLIIAQFQIADAGWTYVSATEVKQIADKYIYGNDYAAYENRDGTKKKSNWINVFVLDYEGQFKANIERVGWGYNGPLGEFIGGTINTDNWMRQKVTQRYCFGWYYCYTYTTYSYKVQDYHIWKMDGWPGRWWHGRVWVFHNVKGSYDLILIQIHRTELPHKFGWYEEIETKFANDMKSILRNGNYGYPYYHVAEEIPMPGNYGYAPNPNDGSDGNGEVYDYQSYYATYIGIHIYSFSGN